MCTILIIIEYCPAPAPHVRARPRSSERGEPLAVLTPPAGQTWKLYYYANGQRIAERVLTSGGTTTLYYLHGDHLGSMSVMTCGSGCPGGVVSGTVTGRQSYYAYGATRVDGNLPTDFGFTGQRAHEVTGLIYFNARWYDPYLNRWVQPDSIVPEPGNPQALNRYSYVYNSPLNFTDPSGHAAVCMCDGIGIGGLYRAYYSGSYGQAAKADARLHQQLERFFEANTSYDVSTSALPDHDKAAAALVQADVISGQWREANLPGIADAVESFDIGNVTLQGGFGVSGFVGAGIRGDGSLAIDGQGGIAFTLAFGGGGYSAAGGGVGPYFTVYDAPSVAYLNGWSVQVGGQVGEGASVAAEKILFLGPDRNRYGGTSISGAARLELPWPGEVHATTTHTWVVMSVNIPDVLAGLIRSLK
jgi:RHS repeat-associated protein